MTAHDLALANSPQPPEVWAQTGTAIAFDMLDPDPALVNFDADVAEALARCGRYSCHVRSGVYSVAQHSVLGCDWLYAETKRPDMAAAFLLHDAHEAYMGDITTPTVQALVAIANREFVKPGYEPGYIVKDAIRSLKNRLDRAIHQAAGLAWPLADDVRETVKRVDIAILNNERRHLLPLSPFSWGSAIEDVPPLPKLTGKAFRVWPWPEAADKYRSRLRQFLPRAIPQT